MPNVKLAIVMDPIEAIKIHKDSSFAMLLEAQRRGWALYYLQLSDLFVRDGVAWGRAAPLMVRDDPAGWFELGEVDTVALGSMDAILMRKDPPFDMEYVYATYILERAEAAGALVVNRAASLRNFNEKFATSLFPQCCPPTLVDRSADRVREFLAEHGDIVVKPLDGMGGASIFRLRVGDPNISVVLETLSGHGQRFFMAQRFVERISEGDKRILMINGRPVPYALARIPAEGELRGNLAAGARAEGVPLGERERWICEQVGPTLVERGLLFVGLDVIGDWLTEINVTSPTCIRELDALYGLNIAAELLDCIEERV
jgi:glutathione synthase